jgi:hypothetical protein
MLTGKGIYARDFRGEEAAGGGISFLFYLLKNKTGAAILTPFIESAVINDNHTTRTQTGIGASISYRLWRIPFPLGINYTYNVTDGSYDISFLFGGM